MSNILPTSVWYESLRVDDADLHDVGMSIGVAWSRCIGCQCEIDPTSRRGSKSTALSARVCIVANTDIMLVRPSGS
jgi:hypothetical protein